MPKIIKDLEENIFNSALKLFGDYGYEKVDMKMIAKDVGIAVGTLYNYYPNKKELFINVFINSWENTFLKLDNVLKEPLKEKEKTRLFIVTLYKDIEDRRGLGFEFSKSNDFSEEEKYRVKYIKDEIYSKTRTIFSEIQKSKKTQLNDSTENRLIDTMLLVITMSIQNYPGEQEENIRFIEKLINLR